jgi:amino acid transporter
MKRALSGLAACVLGLLSLFSFFMMWTGKDLSGRTENIGLFKSTGDGLGTVMAADIFSLVVFIMACLLAAIFLLNLLGILKGKNAKPAALAVSALMVIAGILTMVFVIMAATDESISKLSVWNAMYNPGFGAWITMIGGTLGGLAGCYYAMLSSGKKKGGKKKK